MSTRQHIGELIRERRLARGLSLGQLATQLGKTPAVVRAWERGEFRPDPDLTEALIEALDLDAAELGGLAEGVIEPDEVIAADVPGEEVPAADAEYSDAAATAPSLFADLEARDEVPVAEEPGAPSALTESPTSHALAEEPTEPIPAPVATMEAEAEPSGYDVIQPVVAERPQGPAITVPPLRLPNPIRLLFDPHHRYLYWIRYALTVIVLFILLRVFAWAAGELWTALGDFLDTFRATDAGEEEALRLILGV